MRHRKTILIIATLATVILVLTGMQETVLHRQVVAQPIAFDHARHIQEEMTCAQCHNGVDNSSYATLPTIQTCLLCHKEAKGTHPDEPKIRAYVEAGQEIPWIQVNRVAGHVYFSHGMHVKLGKLECSQCHGDMSAATRPVGESQIDHLTMSGCMNCHEEKGVNQECLTCHK